MKKHYDIIVAGGGMVGLAMACALGKSAKLAAKRILVLEGGPKRSIPRKQIKDPYSNRVVSLNPGTKKFLQGINTWDKLGRFSTVKKLQIWDAYSDAIITFDHPGLSNDISYIVENDSIIHALSEEVRTIERVQIKYESKVQNIILPTTEGKATIQLDGGAYSCDLLIGAEGYNSGTRLAMGSQWLTWNYKQSGVVATLSLAEPTENVVAWQRFLANGPIALLPLNDQLSSLVWTTTPQHAADLVKMSDEAFVDSVNNALWKKAEMPSVVSSALGSLDKLLSAISLPSSTAGQQLPPSIVSVAPKSRASFPLGFGHAAKYAAPSAALIGDAAHRVHPLAGQGVNLGFGDVETLTDVLAQAVYSGEKLGSLNQLAEYERRRQLHNFPAMLTIDGIQKMYNTTATPVVLLRSLGMQLTHALQPVKRILMDRAST